MNHTTHTTLMPHEPAPIHWRSTTFAAKFYGKTRQRIIQWCNEGRFASVGIPIFQDASKRWWIAIPDDDAVNL